MDLGMVGLDGLLSPSLSLDPEAKQNWYGSGFLKQERPKEEASEDDLRASKMSKTCDFSANYKVMPLLRSSGSLFSEGQQMLSFFSPSSSQAMTLPMYQHPSSAYGRNTASGGYGCGGGGVKGPFTPSQWMELEHQALIYKYITANVPIPSNLLIPIRKALDSAGLYGFSGGPLGPTSVGWGAFRLGFSNSADPQPGRCRRTDGKKWRCSRDAVADQKYCERHMNRGRHRSRKPVEGQTGHSVSRPNTAAVTTTTKLMPMASAASASVVPSGNASNGLGVAHHSQFKNLQPSGTNPSPNGVFLNQENVGERIQETQFSIPKHQNPYGLDSSRAEFGLVCSDSLLNPLHKPSSLIACKNYGSSHGPNTTETESHRSLRQFMDDWPNTNQADRVHLSISIPVAPTDYTSSTSSPALSPLRLSRELESTQMGLGVGSVVNEPNQKEANWIPKSWENSMGGPLGEVLHKTNSGCGDYKNSSALNLMTKGWDVSPRLASSPTGVLQKMTFGSLSNSSAGSSPRTESHKTHEGASFFNDLLGSTLAKSSSLPA